MREYSANSSAAIFRAACLGIASAIATFEKRNTARLSLNQAKGPLYVKPADMRENPMIAVMYSSVWR
jgi:hypothetical protein